MSMEPFEKKVRDLPWRKKSIALKERIFASPPPVDVSYLSLCRKILTFPQLAWAATFVLSASMITYTILRKSEPSVAPPLLVQADSMTTGNEHKSFFDLSSQVEAPWSGALMLTIEPN